MIDKWNLMTNWNYVLPPSRPSDKQLHDIALHCSDINKNSNVAVLGSTMEFRDLLFELGFENIFVFERNKDFFDFTSQSRIYNNKENLVLGNWLHTIQNHKNYFSLILSDLTSGNIHYDKRNDFYLSIESALMPDGFFCDKVLTHSNKFLSYKELLKKYETKSLNWQNINCFNCELLFLSDLLKLNMVVDTAKFYEILETETTSKRINKFIAYTRLITPSNFIWHYGKSWEELKTNYCNNLLLISEKEDESNSPYFNNLKHFTLKKIKS